MNHTKEPEINTPSARPGLNKNIISLFLITIAIYGFLIFGSSTKNIKTFSVIFGSIILEAMPFMLLGALTGGLIEAFISREKMASLLPEKKCLTIFVAAGMGIIFPVCECAIVPVVKRLAGKGLPASAAIAYLLGGPIVNPIVFASTAAAYKLNWHVALIRVGLGYLIAICAGLLIEKIFSNKGVFLESITEKDNHKHGHDRSCCSNLHDEKEDEHKGCGCGHDHSDPTDTFFKKILSAVNHAKADFLSVGHFLIIGAFIAALAQTFINRKIFLSITDYPVIPSLLMILLAISLNLCSEADAFIAASFRGLMPFHSQVAFMITGPIFDLKLLLMYQTVFRKKAIVVLSALILLLILAVSLIYEFAAGGTL